MKRISLYVLAILIATISTAHNGYAQIEDIANTATLHVLQNTSYTNNDADAYISATQMDILYVGVPNPVSIKIGGQQSEDFNVEISNGTITRQSGSQWIANIEAPGTATISCISKADNKVLASKKFHVKKIPSPSAYLLVGDTLITNGTITKKMLINASVVAKAENFDFDVKFQIVSFNLHTYIKGYELNEESNSDKFTAKQSNIIFNMERNSPIVIENIQAKCPDGNTVNIGSLCFDVK